MRHKTKCNRGAIIEPGARGRLLVVPVLLAGLVTTGCGMFEWTSAPNRPHQDPYALYERGDHIGAYRGFKILADQGDAGAQFVVGYLHETGDPRDELFGGPDIDEAIKWYRRSAEQGFAKAQSNLGRMYAKGIGVIRDDVEAVRWYRRAAAEGLAEAQYNLGNRYHRGLGVSRDDVVAHAWASLAATDATGPGGQYAATLRDAIAPYLTPEAKSRAERLAREWQLGVDVAKVTPREGPSEAVAPASAPASAGTDIESRFRQLKRLYDQGLITDSDYAERRKEMLQGL